MNKNYENKSYDFSKGVKGKFYVRESDIELPVYLDQENRSFFLSLAKQKKTSVSELVNTLLSKDREILDTLNSKK